jgi:hypothetical protein
MMVAGGDEANLMGWFTPGDVAPTPDSLMVAGGTLSQPTAYATRKGFKSVPDDSTWPNPRWISIDFDGVDSIWREDIYPRTSNWAPSGWWLTSETKLGKFFSRIVEGRMMRYPWPAVIWFSWHYRKN